jgi:hypothetical protein
MVKVFEVFEGEGGGKWGRDNEVRVAATLRQVLLMAFRILQPLAQCHWCQRLGGFLAAPLGDCVTQQNIWHEVGWGRKRANDSQRMIVSKYQ